MMKIQKTDLTIENLIREIGAQKQNISIYLDALYKVNSIGHVGLIYVEYRYFAGRGYKTSGEYQLGIFIDSELSPSVNREAIAKHFSQSFKTGSIITSNSITLLKLDTPAKLVDLQRIVEKIKTLANNG